MKKKIFFILGGLLLLSAPVFIFAPWKTFFYSEPYVSSDALPSSPQTSSSLKPSLQKASTTKFTTPKKIISEPIILHSTPLTRSSTTKSLAAATSTPTILTPQTSLPAVEQKDLYTSALEKVVNLFCDIGNDQHLIASGVIIDTRGYILSNAHVAEKLNPDNACIIRRGSPATPFASAHLVWSPTTYTTSTNEQERARHDVALWKLDTSISSLPFWDIDSTTIAHTNELLLTFSYPAELLSPEIIIKDLHLLFSNTTVHATDGILIESGASITAQQGSSGGILVDQISGKMRGLIFGINSNTDKIISNRTIYALTPQAIDATFQKETGKTLKEYLAGNP